MIGVFVTFIRVVYGTMIYMSVPLPAMASGIYISCKYKLQDSSRQNAISPRLFVPYFVLTFWDTSFQLLKMGLNSSMLFLNIGSFMLKVI